MVTAAQQELAADRAAAQTMVDQFVADRQAQSAQLALLKPELAVAIDTAGTQAVAAIDASAATQTSAVAQQVQAARTAVRAKAATVRAQVEANHASTVAGMRQATDGARTTITGASSSAAGTSRSGEAAQLVRLGGLYTQTEGQFRAAAATAGTLAMTESDARAASYRSHKIHDTDSFLDGYLTDNRCDAQAEAAEKVGAAYRDGLREEGEKQVTALRGRRTTDEQSVHHLADDARTSLATVAHQASDGVTAAQTQSLDNATTAKASVLGNVTETLATAEQALAQHQTAQTQAIAAQAEQRKLGVQQAAAQALQTLGETIDRSIVDVDAGLATLVQQLAASPVPKPSSLQQTLADAGVQLDQQLAALGVSLQTQAGQAGQAITGSATEASTALQGAATAANEATTQTSGGAAQALDTAGSEASRGFQQLGQGHAESVRGAQDSHGQAATSVLDGLTSGFDRMNTNFTAGSTQQVTAVRDGLTASVLTDLPTAITTEAAKAYDQVQPRWKSVLKWIIIIAIVLVVAVVLGPMVIGAVTGAAAALGASAGAAGLIGMVVGGALVGAATSAATTVVDNAFAGRDLLTGVGRAMAIGALGGALGGAASGLLAGPMQGMTVLARYGAQVAVDTVIDTGINAATGNLSWDNLATGLLMSALVNGVTVHPRVQAFQHSMSSRGYGAGFDLATSGRQAVAGRGSIPAAPITIDAGHVNVGDTAKPTTPYRGTWDMAGGGHNAKAIRARAAGEGIGHATLDVDPVTGVAVEKFTRPALDNNRNPIADPAAPGGVKVKSTNKSLFPESMGGPQIESAGRTALARSLAGGPQTTNTAPGTNPNGSVKNGKFSAIVTTPEGHPIRVEGYYAPAPGGGWEIKTIYPATDVGAGQVAPVPGSQVSVPGTVVTPPDYDSGDERDPGDE